jgi:hypothetical protein
MFQEAILSIGLVLDCGGAESKRPDRFGDRASQRLEGGACRRQGKSGKADAALDPSAGGTTPSRGMSGDR